MPPVDQATRTEVVETLAERMTRHYVLADVGVRTAATLRQRLAGGAYDGIGDAEGFAARLTGDLQELTRDKHAEVAYMAEEEGPDRPQNQVPHPATMDIEMRVRGMERMMRAVSKRRFGFPDSRRLAGNVAYVRIDEFPEPILAGQAIAAEMGAVADAAALILDLRENGGGNPDSVTQLCAYLFDDKPVHLNDQLTRGIGRVLPMWTQPVANDQRFGSRKPVFILVGKETFSAAENLAYTLQALKRATIVGVPTGGGAHGGRGFRLSAHFIGGIPNRQTLNSVTHADWEGKGVQPDVRVGEAQALETAQALAAKAIAAAQTL
ncbi:S41 family peptidase [Massilia aerilata]|uniref:S41 family peptidase n=1 Tax=Massilia aerilata TaxID=453817 RepID=A0ABW0S1L6_9BURK